MKSIRRVAAASALIIVTCLVGYVYLRYYSSSVFNASELLELRDVSEIQSLVGKAMYVYTSYPSQMGRELASEDEFRHGVIVEAYLIQKTPPRFLIIKRRRDSPIVLDAVIEAS